MIFEYKVRARHRLGWKEFSFYATTDIEEFLNRNSIEYVRTATDTVEHRLLKEIERLHSIIKEVREYIEKNINENEAKFYGIPDYKVFKGDIEQVLEILDKERESE